MSKLSVERFILVGAGTSSKMTDTSFFPNMIGKFFFSQTLTVLERFEIPGMFQLHDHFRSNNLNNLPLINIQILRQDSSATWPAKCPGNKGEL